MLEGRNVLDDIDYDYEHLNSVALDLKFLISRCPKRIEQ